MRKINKPWGSEEIIEHNKCYALKKIEMNKDHRCSVQYHKNKKETIYLLSGFLKIYIGDTVDNLKIVIMKPYNVLTIDPFKIHRMEAVEDSVYLETSSPELDDVVRLKDDYNRVVLSE